jgi:hypothetical protein
MISIVAEQFHASFNKIKPESESQVAIDRIINFKPYFKLICNSCLYVSSYSRYQYSFRFSYRDILLVAVISIPLPQVKNKHHLQFKTTSFLLSMRYTNAWCQ